MNSSLISMRYANALFQTGRGDEVLLDTLNSNCTFLRNTIKGSSELEKILDNKLIKPEKKIKVFKKVFENHIHSNLLGFVELVISNNREGLLLNMLINFIDLYRDYKGIKSVTLITAIPVDEALRLDIQNTINKQLNSKTELECKVNEDIIGGMILMINGKMADSSVKGKLRLIKKRLLTN